jgi:hypothetical protein
MVLVAIGLGVASGCASRTPTTHGSTHIVSEPARARVYIDERLVGETPLYVRLEIRTHTIRLEKDGYEDLSGYITVVHRDPQELVDDGFGWWWGLDDNAKYSFEEAYTYRLERLSPEASVP